MNDVYACAAGYVCAHHRSQQKTPSVLHLIFFFKECSAFFFLPCLLPFFFRVSRALLRHSKFSSFQRQLNLYQFRKIVKGVDAGGYQHPMFHRDRPEDLCHVRRSVSGSGRYDASAAKASAKRSAAAALNQRQQQQQQARGGEGGGWAGAAGPRARKSAAATRRVGKLRDRAVESRHPVPPASNTIFQSSSTGQMGADHHHHRHRLGQPAVALSSGQQQQQVVSGGGVVSSAAPAADSSDAGERSPWTSGESSDSDASIDLSAAATAERWTEMEPASAAAPARQQALSTDDGEEAEGEDSSSDSEGAVGAGPAAGDGAASRRIERVSDPRGEGAGEALLGGGLAVAASGGGAGGGRVFPSGGGAATSRKSPFNFLKKTLSFMERVSTRQRESQL